MNAIAFEKIVHRGLDASGTPHQGGAGLDEALARIQNDLFDLGADLCRPEGKDADRPPLRITAGQVARLEAEIDRVNAKFARVEQIKKFFLLETQLSAEDEELTPTMKLKRKLVQTKYAERIEAMYR